MLFLGFANHGCLPPRSSCSGRVLNLPAVTHNTSGLRTLLNQALDASPRGNKETSVAHPHRYGTGEHDIQLQQIPAQALWVYRELRNAGYDAYLVGGCVRDLLLGHEPKDFDISTNARPDQVRATFPRSRTVGRRFQIVHVRAGRDLIEVSTFRGHHSPDFELETDDDEQPTTGNVAYAASGMLLRDNVFGTIEEDALRRDFTINGLYYDPDANTVLDYCGGVADLATGTVRVIGDPVTRFQEDPVRMLRAVRFSARLGFSIDATALAAISRCRSLLDQIPAARLFDEVLKLLLTGNGEKTFALLDELSLFKAIFPETARLLAGSPRWRTLIGNALHNSDERIALGKPVTPAFLYAALLWPAVAQRVDSLTAKAHLPTLTAIHDAAPEVIITQCQRTVIPRRFSTPMREIWDLQQRLITRRSPQKLAAHPRFRAAYDFVLLREQSGDQLEGAGDWWTRFQDGEAPEPPARTQPRRRRRRRKPAAHGKTDAG